MLKLTRERVSVELSSLKIKSFEPIVVFPDGLDVTEVEESDFVTIDGLKSALPAEAAATAGDWAT